MKSEGLADAEKDARCGGRSGATLAAPLGSLAAALRQARAEGKNKTSREAMACLATESPMSQTGTSKRESPRPASGGDSDGLVTSALGYHAWIIHHSNDKEGEALTAA
eukprot:scaffold202025_cov30-Tisochrysis_lutea.AAC.3